MDRRPPGQRRNHARRPTRDGDGAAATGRVRGRPHRARHSSPAGRRRRAGRISHGQPSGRPRPAPTPCDRKSPMEKLPAGLHPAQPVGSGRPRRSPPRNRRSAVLSHRRRQDRSVLGTGGHRNGPATPAQPGARRRSPRGRRLRRHALHPAPPHIRPAGPRRRTGVRPGARTRRQPSPVRRMALRDRHLGGQGGNPQRHGPQRRQGVLRVGALQDAPLQGKSPRQARPGPTGRLPVVRRALPARRLRPVARQRQAAGPAHRLHQLRLRLHRRPAPADRRCGRAAVPSAARVLGRNGGQVRRSSVDRPLRRAAGRRRPHGQARLLRSRRPCARPSASCTRAAPGPDHPGRAAPDLGATGHDGGPLRDGNRGALHRQRRGRLLRPPQDRRFDRHGSPSRQPSASAVRPEPDRGVPAPGTEPARLVLRPDRPQGRTPGPALRGNRRPGSQPQGRYAKGRAGAHGRRREGVPGVRRPAHPTEPRRPIHDAPGLLQQPPGAGRSAPHPRRGSAEHPQANRRPSAGGRRTGALPEPHEVPRSDGAHIPRAHQQGCPGASPARLLVWPVRRSRLRFRRLRHRHQHDLGGAGHHTPRTDGRPGPAQDLRRVHPGDQPRGAGP